jgi:hypothetical protein
VLGQYLTHFISDRVHEVHLAPKLVLGVVRK